jgi:hypothetical protein
VQLTHYPKQAHALSFPDWCHHRMTDAEEPYSTSSCKGLSRVRQMTTDEILTYGYVKPQDQGFPTDPSRITQELGGYTYQVHSRAPSSQGIRPSPSKSATSTRGLGARPSPRLPIDGGLDPILGFLPALRRQPRPGHKKTRPEPPRLTCSLALPLGRGSANRSPNRVTHVA